MSMHSLRGSGRDEPEIPDEYPTTDWSRKQLENWEASGEAVYERIDGELGREWYRRTWRPKMRGDGMKQRDHVKLGTPEDYVAEHVADALSPMGDITSVMMRKLGAYSVDKDELDEAVKQIVKAKLEYIRENDPEHARQLLAESQKAARLYGLDQEGDR